MKKLIKEIRIKSGLSQIEMADWLGVTFATVNRWENGHTEPNKAVQLGIYEFCKAHGVPLADMTVRKVESEAAAYAKAGREVLFHGSKEGISGAISPSSRKQCDFGSGFYMGNDARQALCRIADFSETVMYVVSVATDKLNVLNVEPGIDWAMLVAYNRGKMETAKGTGFYRKYEAMLTGKDMVIGSIANDRMYYVLDSFFQGNLTDEALVASLKTLDLGRQYVAVSSKACRKVKIEKEMKMSFLELLSMRDVSTDMRKAGVVQAMQLCREYRRKGRYFDELIGE